MGWGEMFIQALRHLAWRLSNNGIHASLFWYWQTLVSLLKTRTYLVVLLFDSALTPTDRSTDYDVPPRSGLTGCVSLSVPVPPHL